MRVKSISLENFKGVRSASHTFKGKSAVISGKNGIGKTTIADAFFYVFADRDYSLKNKPEIFPINIEETQPKVTVVVEINGVDHEVSKWQVRSIKERNGVKEVTTKNEYSINEVPKSATEFKNFMEEHGINMDKFIECAHPEVFCGYMASKKERDNMRSTLFSAVANFSDEEIAKKCDTKELADLLSKYKMEEIKAMKARDMKAATEQVEGIPDQIIGMEKTKVDYDGSALELEKSSLKNRIKELEEKKKLNSNVEEIKKLEQDIFKLEFDINDCVRKENESIIRQRRSIEDNISDLERAIRDKEYSVKKHTQRIESLKQEIDSIKEENKKSGEQYKKIQTETMDENEKICPNCGQVLPEEKVEEILKTFEDKKQQRMKSLIEKGKGQKKEISSKENEVDKLEKENGEFVLDLEKLKTNLDSFKKNLETIPKEADMTTNDTWNALCREKDGLQKQVDELKSTEVSTDDIDSEIMECNSKIIEVEKKIALVAHNSEIDEQIEELQNQKLNAAQKVADAKMILDQIDVVSRKKNEMLSDSVNSNFKIVKFLLFDYQKNGTYLETCIPTVDGKRLGESMNTGLEIMAKMDIVNGLQNIYGMDLPIFVDKVENLDRNNLAKLMSEYPGRQIIALKVADCDLTVEVL